MRTCLYCQSDLDLLGKNRKANYCSIYCKNKNRNNKGKFTKYTSSYVGKAISLWHNSKTRLPEEHSITTSWIEEKLKIGVCEVTNLPFIFESHSPFTPSLDRKDSSKGYTPENTQVVVWIYNTAKNKFTHNDVLVLAQALLKNGSMK